MEALFRQALACQKAGRLDEAEALYRKSAAWKPEWTLGNLGVILRTTGRLEEAEAALRAALAADPASEPVRHTLGMTLLQLGHYAEGWALYEARRALHLRQRPSPAGAGGGRRHPRAGRLHRPQSRGERSPRLRRHR